MFTLWTSQATLLFAQVHKHPYLVITLILLTVPLIVTYAISTYRFHQAISTAKTNAAANNGLASPTPILPYWIPFLGHTIPLVFNTSRFMRRLASTYGNIPMKVYVGGRLLQFVSHGEPVAPLHRHPRKMTNVLIPVKFMADTGLSKEDQLRAEIDELSGVLPQPNPGWEHLPDHKRWHNREHAVYAAHLSSSAHESLLGAKFAERFTRELLSWARTVEYDGEGWIDMPDLTRFLREKLFIAAASALYGDELLGSIAPDLPKDYWEWLDQMPWLFRRLPRWMIPGAYAARKRTLASLMKWDEVKRRRGLPASKGQWDPLHGSTLTQTRTDVFDEFGISKEGRALFHSAMMFALTPNATYATIWAFIHILREGPDLISRVLAESAPCFQPNSLSITDTTELSRLPLLSSVFMETLRLRAASPVGRTPIDDTFHLSSPLSSSPLNMKWKLDKDVHIISSSWLGGHDASFWNEGHILPHTKKPAHPVDTFWAERFLEYPDDPFSGPVKKKKKNVVHSLADMKEKTASDDKKAKLVTQGTSSHWFPFGGGLNTCPGRHFAKKEVIVGVAVLFRAFEFSDLRSEGLDVNMGHFPFGTLPTKGAVSVRMRIRRDLIAGIDGERG